MPISIRLTVVLARRCWWFLVLTLVLTACSDRCDSTSSSAPPTTAQQSDLAASVTVEQRRLDLTDELEAILRIDDLAARLKNAKTWTQRARDDGRVASSAPETAHALARFETLLLEALGEEAASHLRLDGNVDLLLWPDAPALQPSSSPAPRWAAIIPVATVKPFLDALRAHPYEQDTEQVADPENLPAVQQWSGGRGPMFIQPVAATLAPGQSSDEGPRLVIATFPDGARFGADLLRHLGVEQVNELQAYWWPQRSSLLQRYEGFHRLFQDRLSRSGHNLLPARAALARVQSRLYRALSDGENWPETIHVTAYFKVRSDQFKSLTLYGFTPAPKGTLLGAFYDGLRREDLDAPPRAEGASGLLSLNIHPQHIEELLTHLVPEDWLESLVTTDAAAVARLQSAARKLLEHNRGATTIAVYPQEVVLSGETFIGWRAMDVERLEERADRFHRQLLTDVWMPLFLARPESLKESRSRLFGGRVSARSLTFSPPGADKLRLGACWAVHEGYFVAYYGQDPCTKLSRAAAQLEGDSLSPSLEATTDLATALDLLYMPPAQALKDTLGQVPVHLEVTLRDERILEWQWTITDPAILGALLIEVEKLGRFWDADAILDPGNLLTQTGLEQSMYQDPGFLVIGPPGLLGALPPSYFLGMPFSVAPAPPDQLKQALAED